MKRNKITHKSTQIWLVPDYISQIRDNFRRNYHNFKKYPTMTKKDWDFVFSSSPKESKE